MRFDYAYNPSVNKAICLFLGFIWMLCMSLVFQWLYFLDSLKYLVDKFNVFPFNDINKYIMK